MSATGSAPSRKTPTSPNSFSDLPRPAGRQPGDARAAEFSFRRARLAPCCTLSPLPPRQLRRVSFLTTSSCGDGFATLSAANRPNSQMQPAFRVTPIRRPLAVSWLLRLAKRSRTGQPTISAAPITPKISISRATWSSNRARRSPRQSPSVSRRTESRGRPPQATAHIAECSGLWSQKTHPSKLCQ